MSGLVGDAPYDPVEELSGAVAGGSDFERAEALYATRSERAQMVDEGIQAGKQVVDFEDWAQVSNMMDFVGVDDLIFT